MAWTVPSVRVRVPRIALRLIVLSWSLACLPSLLIAQTISPQIVEFDPSADHNSTVGGVAVVDGYELRFYGAGGTQVLQTIQLGKPTAEADGKIRFNFGALLGTWAVDGVVYEARVAAVGPGGFDDKRRLESVRVPKARPRHRRHAATPCRRLQPREVRPQRQAR